jgi:signal peptidase II
VTSGVYRTRLSHTRLGLIIALLVFVADLATKEWMLALIFDPPRRIVLTGFFNLTPVWNRGVSFGLFAGHQEWIPWILSLVAIIIAAGLFVWLRRARNPLLAVALGLVIGGALGNVIDRVRFGAVVDFLDFHISGYHWPAFNIADAAISLGVVMILYHELFLASGQASGEKE